MAHFGEILKDIMMSNRRTRFTIGLTISDSHKHKSRRRSESSVHARLQKKLSISIGGDDNHSDDAADHYGGNGVDSNNSIPTSQLASQLNEELTGYGNVVKENGKINRDTRNICKYIIHTFMLLYDKYVSDASHFMINVSSRSRNRLKQHLDVRYYQIQMKNGGFQLPKTNSLRKGNYKKDTLPPPVLTLANVASKSQDDIKNSDGSGGNIEFKHTMMLKKFDDYVNNGQDLKQNELYEWLLTILIENTERAVRETAELMKDSYLRFKTDTDVFDKVLELAKKHYS